MGNVISTNVFFICVWGEANVFLNHNFLRQYYLKPSKDDTIGHLFHPHTN